MRKVMETPEAFSARIKRLHKLAAEAVPSEAEFLNLMEQAKAAGMTYREGLEHTIRECAGGAD
jgi:hypothetical protein